MNGLALIVATQSLQLVAVSANAAVRSFLVIVFYRDLADFDVSQKYDVIVRNLKIFKIPEYSSLLDSFNRPNNTVNPLKLLIRKVGC